MSDTLAVMPMNGQAAGQNGRKRRENDDFSVKLSTIRIWMHEKDIGKLTRILWAGQGQRLCQQASNNGRVKRFLAAVPHVMNATKDLHQAVIDNNLETLQMQLEPPVPPALVTAKDNNGLNIIHKAAGLGHTKILEYLIGLWPEGIHEIDITGKTPLHWAASAKNNMRCYTLLTQAGCDEEAQDYKMKTPSYYRHKPHEIERAFLVYVPEAPRISPDSVTDWEALSDDTDSNAGGDTSRSSSKQSKKLDIKPAAAVNGRKSLDDSAENTSELDTNDGTSAIDDEDLSKADAEVEVAAAATANAALPLAQQRRPETPAAFAQGNASDTAGDTESEAENIARALSAEDAEKVEPGAAEHAEDETEASVELVENGELDAKSEQNATEKTEAIVNENGTETEMEMQPDQEAANEAEEQEEQEDQVDTAEAAEEPTKDNEEEEEKATVAAAAAAAHEEEVEEDDDEVQIGLL
ncbi:histone H3.v1 [Drosophila novamexicana]|uniref:histone H3.v1 n=1 Tax=Drosophila novamexicana TaxID=47314 RepID=UPI0011E5A9CB|nr:histone H3.v1 [Drosophila novamexicana]